MNNFTKRRIAFAVAAIGYVSAMVPAYAADDAVTAAPATSADASKLERVEVVGSNIKRAVSTQSTQIETYRTEDFAKQGVTSAQDIINSLASSQASIVGASSVGRDTGGASYANLRNIGPQYTLILVDGRRVANQPAGSTAYAVDLNAIPVDAIDRIDVLKDGAAAVYGTDAIGGVINFITKKNYQGASATVGYSTPTQSGGGQEKHVSLSGGVGDLNTQGWNLQGTFGLSKTTELTGESRWNIVERNPSWSYSTWPSNYRNSTSYVNPSNPNCRGGDTDGGSACLENTSKFVAMSPEVERWNASVKGTKRVFDDSELSLQILHSENKTTTSVAPTPTAGDITLTSSSPFYPAGESGSDLKLYGRTIAAGNRVEESTTTMDRFQTNLEGTLAGWDYRGGLGYSQSTAKNEFVSGWINKSLMQQYVNDGTLNPFSDSNSSSVWNALNMTGELNKATMKMYSADYKMSKDVLALPAGNVSVAFGSEIRREELDYNVNTALATQAMSSGSEDSKSTNGGRTVYAFYGEAIVPVIKGVEASTAVRYDHYSDFGDTVNPKIALKVTPIKEVTFRGSASTGYRAPSLYDMYSPSYTTNTGSRYADYYGCAAGVTAACGSEQRDIMYSGSTNLKPEKSFATSIGTVVQPTRNLMGSVDLWTTLIRDQIGSLPDSAIFADPAKYANLYVLNSDGTLNYVKSVTSNLGGLRTSGVDLAGFWRIPTASFGNFQLSINSTYTRRYDYQLEKDGEYHAGAGKFTDMSNNPVVFRWKTNTTLSWERGEWGATLGANYLSGYSDQYPNDDGTPHRVPAYLLWNGSVTYTWNKQASLTVGARNLFDKEPPYSNQDIGFQTGYDPRYTDIYGRTIFMTMSYKM